MWFVEGENSYSESILGWGNTPDEALRDFEERSQGSVDFNSLTWWKAEQKQMKTEVRVVPIEV